MNIECQLFSNPYFIEEIISNLDDPGQVALVSKTWAEATRISWAKKFELLQLSEAQVQQLGLPKAMLYALCTRCGFAFRRCIDEQGIDVAKVMASQAQEFLYSLRTSREIEESGILNQFMLMHITDFFKYPEEITHLLDQGTNVIMQV